MILGIGTDIISISRIEALMKRKGEDVFLKKNYSRYEIEAAYNIKDDNKRTAYIAKRFAGKEALAKALGTGIGKAVAFKDISILNDKSGKPYILIEDAAADYIRREIFNDHDVNFHISLADSDDMAQAFVVIEK